MIYLVMNEWTGDLAAVTEVVAAHSTLQRAVDHVASIAEDHGVHLEDGETSIYVPSSANRFLTDEYYIEEIKVDHVR